LALAIDTTRTATERLDLWVREFYPHFYHNTRAHIEEANANCREILKDGPIFIARSRPAEPVYVTEERKVNLTGIAREYVEKFGWKRELIKSLMAQDPRCEDLSKRQIMMAVSGVFSPKVRG
jgi:hypothetical protein